MSALDDSDGICWCGHEIDPESRCCMIWDRNDVVHLIPGQLGVLSMPRHLDSKSRGTLAVLISP